MFVLHYAYHVLLGLSREFLLNVTDMLQNMTFSYISSKYFHYSYCSGECKRATNNRNCIFLMQHVSISLHFA